MLLFQKHTLLISNMFIIKTREIIFYIYFIVNFAQYINTLINIYLSCTSIANKDLCNAVSGRIALKLTQLSGSMNTRPLYPVVNRSDSESLFFFNTLLTCPELIKPHYGSVYRFPINIFAIRIYKITEAHAFIEVC